MAPTTGNARPPDDHGGSASNDQGPNGPDWEQPTMLPAPAGASKEPGDLTSLGDHDDGTSLSIVHALKKDAPDDVTRLGSLEGTGRRPTTERRLPPSLDGNRTPAGDGTVHEAAAQEGPLQVGQAFGARYHIIRCLGVGGMGAVYQAWDAELGVAVALKVIRPEIAADPTAAAEIERRFKRELLLARQITHPNIIRIHDLGDIGGIKYITMPFIDGEDLSSILKEEKKIPVARALKIARGTVSGLVSAHQAGVIHRDLKPANIMIGSDETPTIMDFGIARAADGSAQGPTPAARGVRPADLSRTAALAASSTMAGAIVGTVAYMAPEQARGEAVDQRADIYAFGLIMYDMLIGGRRSERAASAVAELKQRMEHAPPPPRSLDPTIPEPVDAIIRRCLEPDLTKRFQTTVELQEAIERLDENGKLLPIMRRVSRRAMTAAAVLVVLLLGGTFYLTRQLSAPPVVRDPVSVLIADFQNTTDDPTFGSTIGQTTKRALEDASFITAFDRTRIRSTFQVQPPDNFDETAARQLAVKQGLGVVLVGSIAPAGNGYEIAVQAIEALSGKVVADVKQRASGKDQVLDTATAVVTRIRTALGDETPISAQRAAMRSLSTSSLEVLTLYAAAVDAQSRGKFEEALQNFSKALELDPKFGLGYQGMAIMSRNLGRMQDAEKYAKEGLQYLDNMTERERFAARANYYARTGDYRQCATEYGELVKRYPADVVAHNQRAGCLLQLRDFQGAVDDLRQIVRILPEHIVYRSNLALTLNSAGKPDEAEQEIRKLTVPYPQATSVLALSHLAQGRVSDAQETFKKLTTMDAWGAAYGTAGLGDLAVYEGRYSEAVRIFEQGAAADLAAKNKDAAALKFAGAAYAYLSSGDDRRATAAAENALEHSTTVPVRFLAARIFVESGELARAQKLAAAFMSQLPAEPQAYGKIIEAGIALKKRDPRLAIKTLIEANEILDTWLGRFDLGRAYLQAGAFLQADSEFDRCIQRRGEALAVVNEDPSYGYFPSVYYYRGRAREGLKTAGFADSYREYLKIRERSTEDPLVADARKRIGN